MTNRSKHTRTRATKPLPAELRAGQAERVLAAFSAWLSAAPGRRVTLEHGPEGWRSTLHESRPSGVRSASLTDAAAQSASVCYAEVGAK